MEFQLDYGYIVGILGIITGLLVAPPQLIKMLKTNSSRDISVYTYLFLCIALVFYLLHAIYIKSIIFTIAQSLNLTFNSTILVILLRHRGRRIDEKAPEIKKMGNHTPRQGNQ